MSESEFEQLKSDIRKNGQLQPIILFGDLIVDGRNRWNAIEDLNKSRGKAPKIQPLYQQWRGECGSPVAYAWSVNGPRRNLEKSQLAAIAVEMLPILEKEAKERQENLGRTHGQSPLASISAKGRSTEHAGKIVGVSGSLVERAKRVKSESPSDFESIKQGKKTVNEVIQSQPKKEVNPKNQNPEREVGLPCVGMQFARIAVMRLKEIRPNDMERQQAFDHVKGWIHENECKA
jgi:hypothetical protein